MSVDELRRATANTARKEKMLDNKAAGKRVTGNRSPPTRKRLAASVGSLVAGRGASSFTGTSGQRSLLGPIYVPQWTIREGSSVTDPEVAKEYFEAGCLFPDLQY